MEGTNQESPLKLPLAPIVSSDRISRNATVSDRRGSSIFSPTKTLDQPYNNNNNPTKLNVDPTSDSDPPHISTTSCGGVIASSSRIPTQIPQNPPPQPPPAPPQESAKTPTTTVNRYKECLKNHAANMGGHVLDGCGEFMPGGKEDTLEYLRCAACDCHRNFHRKEVEGESQYNNAYNFGNYSGNVDRDGNQRKIVSSFTTHRHHRHRNEESLHGFVATTPRMMNFGGGNNNVVTESSSEDLNVFEGSMLRVQSPSSKKRFRTKFSQEQKDKMHEFASKLGWRIQRQDDLEVTRFCNEVGVRRQVFKVWMHNNKQAMKRKSSSEG